MQQMASDIFVRILRGMGACRKKPAQPASGTLSWMTPSETLLRLCLGGFGDMKWAWGGGWRLPAFLCQTTSSPGFCPILRAIFETEKPFENVCTTRSLPCRQCGLPAAILFEQNPHSALKQCAHTALNSVLASRNCNSTMNRLSAKKI